MSDLAATPPPPPSPPSGSGSPKVDVGGWYNQAWQVIQPVWLEYVLAVLLWHVVLWVASLLCFLPALIVIGPLTGGLLVYAAKRLLGMPVEVGDVFKGFRRFGDTLILSLVLFVVPMIAAAVLLVPLILPFLGLGSSSEPLREASGLLASLGCFGSIVVAVVFLVIYPVVAGTCFLFSFPLVMFRGMGAIDSLKRSYELVKPQFGGFLLLIIANFIVLMAANSVGGALFLVGTLILSPLAMALVFTVQLVAYRDFVGLNAEDLAPYA